MHMQPTDLMVMHLALSSLSECWWGCRSLKTVAMQQRQEEQQYGRSQQRQQQGRQQQLLEQGPCQVALPSLRR